MICRGGRLRRYRFWRGPNCSAAARRWTAAYRNVPRRSRPIRSGLIYLAGHQPQMFHPGVWFKNFALGELAGGTARRRSI